MIQIIVEVVMGMFTIFLGIRLLGFIIETRRWRLKND